MDRALYCVREVPAFGLLGGVEVYLTTL